MRPLNLFELKQTAKTLLMPRRRASGLVAAIFMLLANILVFAVTFPIFCRMQEYDTSGATLPNELLMLSVFSDAITVLLSFCFSAVFIAYCLKILKGAPSDGKTIMSSFAIVLKALLLVAVIGIAAAGVSYLYAKLTITNVTLGSLLIAVFLMLAFILFYVFRLCLFSLAAQEGFHPIRAMKECAQLTSGHKKELFFLDLSFLWFSLLVGLVFLVFSSIPDALLILAANTEKAAMAEWVNANYLVLSFVCSIIGYLAEVPLYYRFYTQIQLTYALVYQALKEHQPKNDGTQPLAYMEFDPPQDEAT